jgi:hypothetical protein
MGERAEVGVDFEAKSVTLTFADDVALALAMGTHAMGKTTLRDEVDATRDGAAAFKAWAEALVMAYLDWKRLSFGEPEAKP